MSKNILGTLIGKKRSKSGEMAEWFKAPVLKTGAV